MFRIIWGILRWSWNDFCDGTEDVHELNIWRIKCKAIKSSTAFSWPMCTSSSSSSSSSSTKGLNNNNNSTSSKNSYVKRDKEKKPKKRKSKRRRKKENNTFGKNSYVEGQFFIKSDKERKKKEEKNKENGVAMIFVSCSYISIDSIFFENILYMNEFFVLDIKTLISHEMYLW